MAYLARIRKNDLLTVVDELGLSVPQNPKVADLIKLITDSEGYDENITKAIIERIHEEREEKAKTELAEREFQLKKLEIDSKSRIESIETSPAIQKQNLINLMTKFDTNADVSVYLALFERQISRFKIPKELWVTYLLGLVPLDIVNIIAREPDSLASDYEHVKSILMKRFQLSPEQFRQKFFNHKKEMSASWRDFAFELMNFFEEWLKGLKVSDFKDLKELIVTDQLKRKIPNEMQVHFIDKFGKIKTVDELVCELEDYEAARRNLGKQNREIEKTKLPVTDARPPKTFHRNGGMKSIRCYVCSEYGHYSHQCKHKNEDIRCRKCNSFGHKMNSCTFGKEPKNTMFTRSTNKRKFEANIQINEQKTIALLDSGSEISILSYDFYVNIGSPKLSFDEIEIKGIAGENVSPIGYFYSSLFIENCEVSANLYVFRNINNNVIIGTDILEQLNIRIDQNGMQILGKRNYFANYARIVRNNKISQQETKNKQNNHSQTYNAFAPKQMRENETISDERDSLVAPITREINKSETGSCLDNIFLVNLANAVTETEYDLSHILPYKIRNEVKNLIDNYKPHKTKNTDLKMHIILSDELPVCQKPRRLAFAEQKIVEKQVSEWLEEGIIKNSSSNYSAPVVLCKKKDNSYRLCIDFRKLNKKTIKENFPLPLVEDVLDHLSGASVFTTLDLKNGFFHVDIDEKSTKYTSFVTHNGQYEFNKVAFGLTNSPSVFQRYIYQIFRPLINDGTLVIYLDDIVIPSCDEEEGIEKLKKVFKVASEYGLKFNFKKCQFLKRETEFLGYLIGNGTVSPSSGKTLAVKKFPEPKTVKQVQSFLGLTGYFRKFIPNYALIAKPLSDLLRKNSVFTFSIEQREAFQKLKRILSEKPVLHIFQQGQALELHTDASSHGFGAVLLMKADDGHFHPVYYFSKKTTPQQEKYCSYELEALAVIEALKKFRNYLLGSKFKIVTDCAAFQKTLQKKDLTPKVARWALFMEEFNYEIVHRSGTGMRHVDALSRNVLVVSQTSELTTKITAAQEKDEYIQAIKCLIEKGAGKDFVMRKDVVYKIENGRDLIVVPEDMTTEIVRQVHNKGHFSSAKTEEVLKLDFYIPKLRKQVEKIIANCVQCILYNKKRGKGEGFLNPIPKESIPLSTYHLDFIGPLASTNKNYQHILTVVDAFTKFCWFYPVKTTSTKEVIEKLNIQQNTFGNPMRIITDRGAAFTSKDFEDYCINEGIEHVKITTGIPRGNGNLEEI